MNTQNTPIHVHLWHRDFWIMVVANFLLSMSVTMLIPTLPRWMMFVEGLSSVETGLTMGSFAFGLFLPGAFCSFLVQHYRRNQVCVWAAVLLGIAVLLPIYVHPASLAVILLMRIFQGAAFGLAQIVLSSTLIIDTCESFQRTEANHSATWFGRFALSLGPMAGLLLYQLFGLDLMFYVAAGCSTFAAVLILMVHFPFRVPSDHVSVMSLDRFFLEKGWPLFISLQMIMAGVGMLLSLPLAVFDYALMMVGFLLALLAQRFVFPDADLKSEVVSGLLLVLMAELIMLYAPQSPLHTPLLGLGLGLIGARFLLFFIKLSRHCQRGTAQSSFLLAWESGIALGIGIGYMAYEGNREGLLQTALCLTAVPLVLYVVYLHQWFVMHKNR